MPGIAELIDHTLLKPEATADDIRRICDEARTHGFASVCVNPYWVPLVAEELAGSKVKACAVVGFPLGANASAIKAAETLSAVEAGAREIDMVINIGALKSRNRELVHDDVAAVAEAVHGQKALLKVILETGLLTDDERRAACEISEKAGADFVKTSTGFLGAGATVEDVALMRRTVKIGVKASGGIRTAADARKMIEAGATRLGTSNGVAIVREMRGGDAAASQKSAY